MLISTVHGCRAGAIALVALASAVLALPALALPALANVAITTDRVQVQVGNNGQVYIRTLADGPAGRPRVTVPQVGSSLPAAACTARSHSAHSTRSTPGGTVVYSENRNTTRVCQ